MKKLLSVLLATAMLLSLLSVSSVGLSVAADSTDYNKDYDWDSDLWYYITENNEVVISGSGSSSVVIPETVLDYPVVGIDYLNSDITEITIPASIKWIEADTFSWPMEVQKVNISDLSAWCQIDFANGDANPLCFEADLYMDGELVTDLVIPSGIEEICDYAFYGCNSITSLVIPDGVTSIGQDAFWNCGNLTDVTIPPSVTCMKNSFDSLSNIENVYIEDLGAWCEIDFSDSYSPLNAAESLYINGEKTTFLRIPRGTTRISDYAFWGFKGFTELEIPNTVTEVGRCALIDCPNLEHIYVYASSPYYKDIDGVLFTHDGTSLALYPAARANATYTIPNTVTTICDGSFRMNKHLKDLVISDNVEYIGMTTYAYSASLESVTIGKSVNYIGQYGFSFCDNLEKVEIRDLSAWCNAEREWNNATPFEEGADLYMNGQKVTDLVIPDDVEIIRPFAFCGCTSIKSITIPRTVKTIGSMLFFSEDALTDVWYFGTEQEREALNIDGNNVKLLNAQWHYNACPKGGYHKYDNACDTDCNMCGATREVGDHVTDSPYACVDGKCQHCQTAMTATDTHKYDNACDTDCNVCGATREVGDHVTDSPYACVDGKCQHCQTAMTATDTHKYDNACDTDCNVCGATREVGDHSYDHDGDTGCNNCDFTRVVIEMAPHATTIAAKKGETAELALDVMGKNLTYTWYYKNKGDSKFAVTKTFTDNRYFVEMNAARSGRQIYCVVADPYGNTVTSDVVTLGLAATITKESATGCYAKRNAVAKATVIAEGDGLTYQWFVKNPGATEYVKSSLTTATYSAKMTATNSGRLIHCIVTDAYGNQVKSKTFVMRMQATIVTQPKSVTVKNGATAKTTVKAAGDGLTYTWYVKNKGAKSFTKSSIKSATYSVKMSTKVNGRQVYCVVKDKYGKSAKSSTVTLKKK